MSSFDDATTSTATKVDGAADSVVDALADGASKIAIAATASDASDAAVASADSVSAAAIGSVDLTSDKPVRAKAAAGKSLAAHLSAGTPNFGLWMLIPVVCLFVSCFLLYSACLIVKRTGIQFDDPSLNL